MTSSQAIDYIRRTLRDYETPVRKGTFWSDDELLLILNQTVLVFFRFAIDKGLTDTLRNLVVAYDNVSYNDALYPNKKGVFVTGELPENCAHPINAYVRYSDFPILDMAEWDNIYKMPCDLYRTVDGIPFVDSQNKAAIIIDRNFVYWHDMRFADSKLYIHYYRYPTPFALNDPTDILEFNQSNYNNILRMACSKLGTKETDTKREIRSLKTLQKGLSQDPIRAARFTKSTELPNMRQENNGKANIQENARNDGDLSAE